MRSRLIYLSIVIVAFATCAAAGEKRTITEKDLFKFVWVADPQIAPDGSQVMFVRVIVNEKTDQYESNLWVVKADGSEPPATRRKW